MINTHKMLIQRYTVIAEDPEMAAPAQFVFEDNDSDLVTGFIYSVNGDEIEIVLFEPADLSDVDIVSFIEGEQNWPSLLNEALETNPDMKPYWFDALNINTTVH